MKVYWTAEARARLLEIQAFIAKDSPQSAREVTTRLLARSRKLVEVPLIARHLPEYPVCRHDALEPGCRLSPA